MVHESSDAGQLDKWSQIVTHTGRKYWSFSNSIAERRFSRWNRGKNYERLLCLAHPESCASFKSRTMAKWFLFNWIISFRAEGRQLKSMNFMAFFNFTTHEDVEALEIREECSECLLTHARSLHRCHNNIQTTFGAATLSLWTYATTRDFVCHGGTNKKFFLMIWCGAERAKWKKYKLVN